MTKAEDFEQTHRILDRMALYEIVEKYIVPGQSEDIYRWTDGFMHYINASGQLLHENPKAARIYRKEMSGLEFIQFVVLPIYLAVIKITEKRRNALPEGEKYGTMIESSLEEIIEEGNKIVDVNKMSNDEWYELDYMSKLIHSKLLLDLERNTITLPNTIVNQIRRGVHLK
jgi:hypothetical protein